MSKEQISTHVLTSALCKLATLRFFPQGEGALRAVGEMLKEHCESSHEVNQAVKEILKTENEWPGPAAFVQLIKGAIPRKERYSSAGTDPYASWIPPWSNDPT